MRFTAYVTGLPAALAVAAIALTMGCYDPKIPEGALKCGGPGRSECPEGWTCVNGACYSSASVAPGADAGGGTGGGGGSGGSGGNDAGANMCVSDQFAGCTRQAGGVCDPVCQQGCGCAQRCALASTTTLGCFATERSQNVAPNETCDPNATSEKDVCRPGTICLSERGGRPECGAHCYRICREDKECVSAKGAGRCLGEVRFDNGETAPFNTCTPPIETCDPVGTLEALRTCRDKYGENFGCYMLSRNLPDEHICDCKGLIAEGAVCGGEHDCIPGNECINIGGKSLCRKLCREGLAGALACPATQTCTSFPASRAARKLGYCAPL